MKIAVMQPYLFPYIGYFQLINAVDKFVIYDDVNFINKGWINRNKILVNDKENTFTIPLLKSSQNKLICDLKISNNNWKPKFLKTITHSYKKAPYYREVYGIISEIVNSEETRLSRYIFKSLIEIKKYLDIKTEFVDSSSIYNNSHLKHWERIIDICIKEDSNHYINPIGGIELYRREIFSSNGIEINFLKSNEPHYKQFNNDFVNSLSIIDVLMFNSKSQVKNYLNEYVLI